MKIALVSEAWHPLINGVVTTWTKVIERFESWGHEVKVLHPGLFRTMACPFYREIRLPLMPGRKVTRLLDDWQCDAIHIGTEGPLGMAARRYCVRRKISFTTSYHTQFPEYVQRYTGIPASLTYHYLRWFHGGAARTLVPTPSMIQRLEQRGFANMVCWTRGVEFDTFQPWPRDFLSDPRPILLYAGRVAIEKNLEAFCRLKLPGIYATKYIVGDGPAMQSLKQRHPDIYFPGYKRGKELAQYMAAADVFVFPSKTDTFGVVMIEALACGTPIAAYRVTGPIDIIHEGRNGSLDDDLSQAVIRALRVNRRACLESSRQYTWERCAQIVLDSLAVNPKPGGGSV